MNIWKYVLNKRDDIIEMPVGSKILSCGPQYDKVVVWVLVDEEVKLMEARHIVAYMTGEKFEIDRKHVFIGTCSFKNGSFILHVFEKRG